MAITSDIDKIRLEIGATDINASVTLYDDEITYALTQESSFWGAAARCAEMLSMKWTQKVDVRLGRSMQLTYSKMAAQYAQQAKRLRTRDLGMRVPWAGGTKVLDKELYENDATVVQPAFTRTMQENPRAGGYTSDTGGVDAGGEDE